ncbi:MAG: hypothetical protein ACSLFP_00380 [Acidimicrobiales bacterium]
MGYRGKIEEQNRARDLRSLGWTLGEICEELGVSKASASLWCRNVALDEAVLAQRRRARHLAGNEGARQRGPNKLQRRKAAEIEEMQVAGREAVSHLSLRELLLVGAALYAGEGSKTPGEVRFANADPRMIEFYVEWLRRCFGVETSTMRLRLYLHEGLDLDAANRFWSDLTGIPTSQFRKPYRATPDPSIRRSKHPMGCPSIGVCSMRLHRRVTGLVDALLSSSARSVVDLSDPPASGIVGPG